MESGLIVLLAGNGLLLLLSGLVGFMVRRVERGQERLWTQQGKLWGEIAKVRKETVRNETCDQRFGGVKEIIDLHVSGLERRVARIEGKLNKHGGQ